MKKLAAKAAAVAVIAVLPLAACSGRSDPGSSGGDPSVCSPGITDTTITLGNSTPQSGPAAAYVALSKAYEAYFDKVNAAGGVTLGDGKTRELVYKTIDDQYDPARTLSNARTLIERENAFALISVLGTSPNLAIADYLAEEQVPNVFALTGSTELQKLTDAGNPWTVAFLPSYAFEAQVVADAVLEASPSAKIAILYQNDGFGKGMLELFEAEFEGTGAEIVRAEPYDIAGGSIDSQVVNLANSGADVWINQSTGTFVTQSLKKAAEVGWKPYTTLSWGSIHAKTQVGPAGADATDGVRAFSYSYDVSDDRVAEEPGVVQWRELAESAGLDAADSIGAIGYIVAQLTVQALENTDGCTRQDFLDAVNALTDARADVLLPGISAGSGDATFPYLVTQVKPMVFSDGRWDVEDEIIVRDAE